MIAVSGAKPVSIHLLNWNIDRGYKLDEIAAEIRRIHPDIATLQEVDLNARRTGRLDVAKDLASRLGLQYAWGKAFEEVNQGESNDPAYQGQATLTSYTIRSRRVLQFARQTSFWKPEPYLPKWFPQRRIGGRVALVTELEIQSRRVVVYNLHLESRGPGVARFEQLKETVRDARTYASDVPVIVAGDLNTKYFPSRFAHQLEAEGFRDCFNGSRPRTHHLAGSLDWIFVRGPAICEQARVVKEAKPSDHYPLSATIELR
ncbi:MAG: endonuclease/exonuclease/phosphatase family protein [Acidobacteriaceae bacterium]|nr:endonuclease/exonuclease/phosphatase family protein [Acidobacteriaceae bacterium]